MQILHKKAIDPCRAYPRQQLGREPPSPCSEGAVVVVRPPMLLAPPPPAVIDPEFGFDAVITPVGVMAAIVAVAVVVAVVTVIVVVVAVVVFVVVVMVVVLGGSKEIAATRVLPT